MANICDFSLRVNISKNMVERFLSFFDCNNNQRCLSRTALLNWEINENEENVLLELDGECAWSCVTCWEKSDEHSISMLEALKECNVISLIGRSEECGFGFYEIIRYKDSELTIDCIDWNS